MAVRAADRVTLAVLPSPSYVRQYYVLQESTLSAPALPTTNPPAAPWVLVEPTYSSGSTSTLYTVMLTAYGSVTFTYGPVQVSSSFEVAKQAYNVAANAQTVADALNNLTNGWKSPGTTNINGAAIQADTIVAAAIGALAITAKHTITGAIFRTASSGQRVEINSSGLIAYDSGGAAKTSISTNGLLTAVDAIISGTTRTAVTGARVEVGFDAASGYRGSVKFINDANVVSASTYMDPDGRLVLAGPGGQVVIGNNNAWSQNWGDQWHVMSTTATRHNGRQLFTLNELRELYGPELTMTRRFQTRAHANLGSGSGSGYQKFDRAVVYADSNPINNGEYIHTGGGWVPCMPYAEFTTFVGGLGDGGVANAGSVSVDSAKTNDGGFATAVNGGVTIRDAGMYSLQWRASIQAAATNRSFLTCVVNGTEVGRIGIGLSEDASSVGIGAIRIVSNNTNVTFQVYKHSGGVVNVVGRIYVTRLS